jgi:hypothetical protein
MSGGWRVLVAWGLLLVALAAVEVIFGPNGVEIALLGGAGAATVAVGLVALVTERRGADVEVLPDASLGAVAVAAGLTLFVLGWEVGQWVMGIGAGVALAGAGLLIRERS